MNPSTTKPLITELADQYFAKVIENHPEIVYNIDVPLSNIGHNDFSSNKEKDIVKWQNFEDKIYQQLQTIDESQLIEKKHKISYWLLKEKLECSIGKRICKEHLWDVNYLWGWQYHWMRIAKLQPVGTTDYQNQALERWGKFSEYAFTEIDNLKQGIKEGYTMPKEIVKLVINQFQALIDYKIEDSPFMSPANRDTDVAFYAKWEQLFLQKIKPSLIAYHQFLKNVYLDAARVEVSILSLPNGEQCYQAYIRARTNTNKLGSEIYQEGLKIVEANKKEVVQLGKEQYQIEDFLTIIEQTNNNANGFENSEEILTFNEDLIKRARQTCQDWFEKLPTADIQIKPLEPHERGAARYQSATKDTPPYYRFNLKNPQNQLKSMNERTAIHEAYPGHHLQIGIEKEIEGLHPITQLISFMSYREGWARYAEGLAEEMGLYQTKAAQILRRAWPARGMVVDPAIHLKYWTKEQAIAFMMEGGMNEAMALMGYQRSIVGPAQLACYDVGGEEIKALRKMVENVLGDQFDIKEFHSKILENGAIPLRALRWTIEEWLKEKTS